MRGTQPKVHYLHPIATLGSEEDILRLEVSVHVVLLVDVVHALQHGQHHLAYLPFGQSWGLPEESFQLPTFYVLHLYHNEVRSLEYLSELDYAGVVEGLQYGRLILQDIYGLSTQCCFIYDLQRAVFIRLFVLNKDDNAKGTYSQKTS